MGVLFYNQKKNNNNNSRMGDSLGEIYRKTAEKTGSFISLLWQLNIVQNTIWFPLKSVGL